MLFKLKSKASTCNVSNHFHCAAARGRPQPRAMSVALTRGPWAPVAMSGGRHTAPVVRHQSTRYMQTASHDMLRSLGQNSAPPPLPLPAGHWPFLSPTSALRCTPCGCASQILAPTKARHPAHVSTHACACACTHARRTHPYGRASRGDDRRPTSSAEAPEEENVDKAHLAADKGLGSPALAQASGTA